MFRISLGIVSLVLCILLIARSFDLLPDPDAAAVERRRVLCESIALECALTVQRKEIPPTTEAFVRAQARRNPEVLSVGVRDVKGRLTIDTGEHDSHWLGHSTDRSTPTHMHTDVPLKDGTPWVRVEVVCSPLPYSGPWRYIGGSLLPLLAFVGLGGILAITFYLRTVFRRVDMAQSKVVPQQVRATLNTLAEGVLVLDRNGTIALANDAFARSVGTTPDALRGKGVSDLPWHAGTAELDPAERPWMQAVRDATPQMGRILGLRDTTGGKTMSVNSAPIFGADGTCRGALATFDDLTQVEKAKASAEAASKAKGEFLANVSHEIRTPMNAIIGMTELVLEGRLSAEQRECLDIVGESAGSLLAVINDLLDLSKIEAGKFDLDPVEFGVRTVLDEALQPFALRAHEKGLELGCDVDGDVPDALIGDPTRLRQVVVNLVGNAIKFTAAGEVVVRVRLEQKEREVTRLHFSVIDTGIGIPTDKLQAIFEPFTQADAGTTRRFGGTGLGLTISAHLVGLMGGEIWAESESGRGSAFHFSATFGLPAAVVEGRSAPDISLTRNLRALVVDGSATTRKALVTMLADLGIRATPVEDSRSARVAVAGAAEPFAVAFVAAGLPDGEGFALAEEFSQRGIDIAVLMMIRATDLQRDIDRCSRAGAGHLRKPIKRADLQRVLHRLINPNASMVHPRPEPRELPRAVPPCPIRLRVLVVEDNPFNQKVAAMKLERWGHVVYLAGTGREALATLATADFDVLFTDIQMPDLDGFELTAAVRKGETGTGRRLPVIAMTAHAMKGVREQCLAAGMDDYVSKPIRDEDLLAALRRATGGEPLLSGPDDTFDDEPQDTDEVTRSPVFDEDGVLARVGGNRSTLVGLIEVLHQDCHTQMAELETALQSGDGRGVHAAAHTLKGMVSFFGAGAAVEAARRLESAGERGHLTDTGHAFADLAQELKLLLAALTPYVPAPEWSWQYERGHTVQTGTIWSDSQGAALRRVSALAGLSVK